MFCSEAVIDTPQKTNTCFLCCFVSLCGVDSGLAVFCVLCALTGHSAGSIWGQVCSLQCLWSDTVQNHPPPLWQRGLEVLDPQQQDYVKKNTTS